MKMVLQKFIAESGLCSRRKAEEMIKDSMKTRPGVSISVNGKPAELGMMVDEEDDVRINGRRVLLAKKKIYIILNKPKGYTCTNRKFKGEKNIFDLIDIKERLFVVGRLDKDSRGLVFLTNDGELAQKLTHPKFEHEKIYLVTTQNSKLKTQNFNLKLKTDEVIIKFMRGIDIGEGDGTVKVKRAKYLGESKFEIVLTEGKKRQIRRMFKAVGLEVEDLVRTQIGKIKLDNLLEGKWKYIPPVSFPA